MADNNNAKKSTAIGGGGSATSSSSGASKNSKTAAPAGSGSATATATTTTGSSSSSSLLLAATYPVNSLVELRLNTNNNDGSTTTTTTNGKSSPDGGDDDGSGGELIVRGLVYCTDEISNSVVLRRSLPHTTLSSEITVINAASVVGRKTLDLTKKENEEMAMEWAGGGGGAKTLEELKRAAGTFPPVGSEGAGAGGVSRRALEERERRAMRLAEESFGHVNQRATPQGQKIFDKLLKACGEVAWKGESILVLKEIRVDPPYMAENCSLVSDGSGSNGLDEHSLERVKKIVAAAAAAAAAASSLS